MGYKKIAECPKELQDLINEVNILPGNLTTLKKNLSRMHTLNIKFQITKLINEKMLLEDIVSTFKGWKTAPNTGFTFRKGVKAFTFNQSDKTLKLESFRALVILTKHKVSIERVRICPICSNFYWAQRIDASACKGKCTNSFNQNTHLIKETDRELTDKKDKLKKAAKAPGIRERLEKEIAKLQKDVDKYRTRNGIPTKKNPSKLKNFSKHTYGGN